MDVVIFLLSFTAAFVFALGGVGAAIILIPILVALGIPVDAAKPVGLFFNTVSLSGASISNIRNKRLDFKVGIPIILSSFLFAVVGALLSRYIAPRTILILFIAFLLFSGFMLLFHKRSRKESYVTDASGIKLLMVGGLAGVVLGPAYMQRHLNPKTVKKILAVILLMMAFKLILKII